MKRVKIDLVEQKFGRLEVLQEVPLEFRKNLTKVEWECLCECGQFITVYSGDLRSKHTQSCGCIKKEIDKTQRVVGKFMMDNRKYDPKISSAMDVYGSYKDGDLTFEQAMELFSKSCEYCGLEKSNSKKKTKNRSQFYIDNCEFKYNGIDRIDSSLKHLLINSLTACKFCNIAKNNQNTLEFLERIKNIYNNIFNIKIIELKNKNKLLENFNEYFIKNNFINDNKKTNKYFSINSNYSRYNDGDLNNEEFIYLVSLNCIYCNSEPINRVTHRRSREVYYYNGLDRIDSTLTHTLDNVLTCCKHCNSAKNTMTYEQFQEWIGRAYNYLFVMNNVENILNKYNNLQEWIKHNNIK